MANIGSIIGDSLANGLRKRFGASESKVAREVADKAVRQGSRYADQLILMSGNARSGAAERLAKAVGPGARTPVRQGLVAKADSVLPGGIRSEIAALRVTPSGLARAKQAEAGAFSVGTFNVENFFPKGVGIPGDRATPLKSPEELKALAAAFRQLDADVVGVQEIYDTRTLREFVEEHLSDMGYRFAAVTKGNDTRGINVGILSRLPLTSVTSHVNMPILGNPGAHMSRDLLHATVQTAGGEVDAFVIHLKSSRIMPGRQIAELAQRQGRPFETVKAELMADAVRKREAEAFTVRDFVSRLEARNPERQVILIGDGNDVPGSKTVRILLGELDDAADYRSLIATEAPGKATHHSGDGIHSSQIDQLDVDPDLNKMFVPGSLRILTTPEAAAASDHFPARAVFDPRRRLTKSA